MIHVQYFIGLVIIVLLNIAIGITGFVQVGLADRVQVVCQNTSCYSS